jgi:hypothetical protein
MFENATDMIQKHLPAGNHPSWVAPVITLFIAWVIFMMIREFWCWFWKTTAIANELDRIKLNIHSLQGIGARCEEELSKANTTLERIAENASAAAGNKQAGSAGN